MTQYIVCTLISKIGIWIYYSDYSVFVNISARRPERKETERYQAVYTSPWGESCHQGRKIKAIQTIMNLELFQFCKIVLCT